ncbi:PTS sugar transporter subunit IIA [Teredinibacter turnerae]|uniref:Nitrogen regulatory protein n=1 Tax=Teredinibacter turnerae (strain ATCC 39867 / T7901) TaxID=377629 RepID=C5BSX5_TERTT|nr:PTS sugar transporter subunit IIA [Teredinibacter turnerae]ACR11548.1 nitrogen regulatory protein [Teredinibacter turnerae T7901]
MQISTILNAKRTRAKIAGGSKKRLIETLAGIFSESDTGLDQTELFQHIFARERLGSTGIGGGIAIPHCRFNTEGATLCACVTLEEAIDFDAVDSKPVDLIFAMLVPENAEDEHLQTLAALAETLQRDDFVKRLRNCKTDEELFNVASGVN